MHIQDWLAERTKSLFVGRRDMMAMMRNHATASDWKLLHLYGPGGIGKTTLLRQFADGLPDGAVLFVDDAAQLATHLDPQQLDRHEAESDDIRSGRIAASLNARADSHGSVVLLIDGLEHWSVAADWLREQLLPRLKPDKIKIITAGRLPLRGKWQEDGWQLLVNNQAVSPLTPGDIRQYAAIRGIAMRDTVESLVQFSKGVPLAMSLASELILRKEAADFLQPVEQSTLIGMLAGQLMHELAGTPLERFAEAAAVVLTFDQELLQMILGEAVSTASFREFCAMPIVVQRQERWSLHDAVREWIATDFQQRKPQAWQDFRHNALAALKSRSALSPSTRTEIGFEQLFLHESPFIRSFCFQLDNQLDFLPVREKDFERVEQLYLAHLQTNSNANPADPHLAPLIRPLWHLQPDAYLGLWQEEELIAFITCHRYDEPVRALLRDHPITRQAVSVLAPDEATFLMCLSGANPDMEMLVNGSMARAIPKLLKHKARYVNLLPPLDWETYLTLLGYERLPGADSASTSGTPYRAYMIDLTREDLIGKIERLLPDVAGHAESAVSQALGPTAASTGFAGKEPETSFPETVNRINRLLKRYHKLPQYPEYAREFLPLLPPAFSERADEAAVQALQARSLAILDRLAAGNPEEQRHSRILRYAYIQKIGTHEAVAEFLNIPVPSYFRYLKAAVRRFAYEWVSGF